MTDRVSPEYSSSFNTWIVTTEGDVEGRTIKNLGTHTGHIDEIAFALADQAYYGLKFSLADPINLKVMTKTEVNISLDIDSKTWDMPVMTRVNALREILTGRPVTVEQSNLYASVKLFAGISEEQKEAFVREILIRKAKTKLTPEEFEALTKGNS